MMAKVMSMLGFGKQRHHAEDDLDEIDVKIQEQRQLARLAKSELIATVFNTVADDARRAGRR